jgi:FkbM family methyltransferase
MRNLIKTWFSQLTPTIVQDAFIRCGRCFEWMRIDPVVRQKMEAEHRSPRPVFPSVEASLITLKELGWKPGKCIDVGAYHGEWSKMFSGIFPGSKLLMIEAQDSKREHLSAASGGIPGAKFEIALLGPEDDIEVQFAEMETGSSVLEESSPFPRSTVTKKLCKLDSLLQRHPEFTAADMLKLDTQGYELEILKGAGNLLANLKAVLLETSLIPINKNAPTFSSVVSFMHERGFELFDFCSQIRRKDGVLWQTDLFFLRQGAFPIKAELTLETWG